MTLSHFVSILAAISLTANPSSHAIPVTVNPSPSVATTANMPTPPAPPHKTRPESLGVTVTAKSAIVVDVASGAVLFAKDAKVQRPIASLTKLMTAMTVLDQGLDGDKLISIEAGDFEETSMFSVGDTFTRADAFKAMLTGSVNEIANAFARTSPGGRDAFLDAMRAKAEMLGMDSAVFADASGVNPGSKASALDVARMLRSALGYPEIRDATSMPTFVIKNTIGRMSTVKSTNLLMTSYLNADPYKIVAGKTGSLPEAGFCLAQATQDGAGHQIIAVGLDSIDHFSRFQDVKALTGWAFNVYEWQK